MNVPYKGRFKITQKYKGLAHDGFDMVGIDVKTIYSTVDGIVERAGWENPNNHSQGFGQYVRVKDDMTNHRYYYGHLSKISVKVGQSVKIGDKLGVEGNTGYSFGSHCHYCVRANADKNRPLDISALTGLPNKEFVEYETKGDEEMRYKYFKDVSPDYKKELGEIIDAGALKGKGGTGDNRIIDLGEDAVRVLCVFYRLLKKWKKGKI